MEKSPEERWAQVVELLATAAVRLARKQQVAGGTIPADEISVNAEADKITASKPIPKEIVIELPEFPSGRVPFGENWIGHGTRNKNMVEIVWMKRILTWASEGCSLTKLAEKLNRDDHETRYAGGWNRARVWWVLKRAKNQFASMKNNSSDR